MPVECEFKNGCYRTVSGRDIIDGLPVNGQPLYLFEVVKTEPDYGRNGERPADTTYTEWRCSPDEWSIHDHVSGAGTTGKLVKTETCKITK